MNDAVAGFNFLLDQAERDRKERIKNDLKQRAEWRNQLSTEALQAIALLADAARTPEIARSDLREARLHLEKALDAAFKLDPEEFEQEEVAAQRSPSGTNHDLTADQRADMPRTV